jgi:glycosyltransferase involved in cell wall biosynthesis
MAVRAELGVEPAATLLVHAGSVGAQYGLGRIDPLFEAMKARGLRPRLMLLNNNPSSARATLAISAPRASGDAIVQAADAHEVGDLIALADAGLAFREASPSMRAVAPVKLAEYLLCGLPVVGSIVAGDPVEAVAQGVLIDQEEGAEVIATKLEALLRDPQATAKAATGIARARYSLDRMVTDYARAMTSARGLLRQGPQNG